MALTELVTHPEHFEDKETEGVFFARHGIPDIVSKALAVPTYGGEGRAFHAEIRNPKSSCTVTINKWKNVM